MINNTQNKNAYIMEIIMAKHGTMKFTGNSKTEYNFTVYSYDTPFHALGAVYIVTNRQKKAQGGHMYSIIYIGETGDLAERLNGPCKTSCLSKYKKNAICIYGEDNEQKRLDIESDLLANYSPPCNG
jgi:hypothetical protein